MSTSNVKIKFLAIDDEAYVRRLYGCLATKMQGVAYFFAQNEKDAVFLAKREQPELITLDLNMPGIGGENLVAHLHEVSPQSRICIVSAFIEEEKKQIALEKGAYTFLEKPVSLYVIKDLIEATKADIGEQQDMPGANSVANLLFQ